MQPLDIAVQLSANVCLNGPVCSDLRERLQNLDGERQLLLLHEKRRREAVQKKGKKRR